MKLCKLLQELAHDLRTPIASLKNLIELLENNYSRLDDKTRNEMFQLSSKEIDYFARLVEDLLVLSQVHEPKFKNEKTAQIQLQDILQNEIDRVDLQLKNQEAKIMVEFEVDNENNNYQILGDPYLLQRMIRNALENAKSFAQSKIRVRLNVNEQNRIQLDIVDDGPGFSQSILQNFGERKLSRQVLQTHTSGSRLSIGLGSVIMKKICEVHGGQLNISNSTNEKGSVSGAHLQFIF